MSVTKVVCENCDYFFAVNNDIEEAQRQAENHMMRSGHICTYIVL